VVKSYITLLSTISPMFELCKGRVDFDALGLVWNDCEVSPG
jgi:hypothetical protein